MSLTHTNPPELQTLSDQIAAQTAAYLRAGGKVTVCPPCTLTEREPVKYLEYRTKANKHLFKQKKSAVAETVAEAA